MNRFDSVEEALEEIGQLKDDMIVTTVMSNIGLYKACDKVGLCGRVCHNRKH